MANILIIDDDPDIVESMRVVLESKGHAVLSAVDGQEGMNQINREVPDLVVLDVMMPKKDGFEVAREIKSNSATEHIPILMLTAINEKTGLDFKKEVGDKDWLPVDDYCEKPLDHQILIAKVETLLKK